MSVLSIKYESHFLDLVYQNEGLQKIVEEGAAIIGTPVRFSPENRIEYAVFSSGYPKDDLESIKQNISDHGEMSIFLGVSQSAHPELPFISERGQGLRPRIFCNVIIGDHYYGNLSIPEDKISLRSIDMDLVLMLSRTIAISCAVHGTWGYDINRDNLFQRILNGTVSSQKDLLSLLVNPNEIAGKKWKLICSPFSEGKQSVILQTALQRGFPNSKIVVQDGAVVMLLDVTDYVFTQQERQKLERYAESYGCSVGISMDFTDILQSREQMIGILKHPALSTGKSGVFDMEENLEYYLFHSAKLDNKTALTVFGKKVLEIKQYDRDNNTDYYDTICAYIDSSYNIANTAEAVHAHKNTVLYRITRIQDLFDVDLRSSRDLFRIQLAISALTYWSQQ